VYAECVLFRAPVLARSAVQHRCSGLCVAECWKAGLPSGLRSAIRLRLRVITSRTVVLAGHLKRYEYRRDWKDALESSIGRVDCVRVARNRDRGKGFRLPQMLRSSRAAAQLSEGFSTVKLLKTRVTCFSVKRTNVSEGSTTDCTASLGPLLHAAVSARTFALLFHCGLSRQLQLLMETRAWLYLPSAVRVSVN
jgi:hypothetical protein